ncbi:MAG: SAM-dependent methyltransferase [Campylobacteraceae bacterium]|nr:SAM-dependent methyltransferase [Campylobacteraceae bacterium]
MNKTIKFSTYFNNWLYGDSGYYTKYNNIGKKGDFYTAVSTSSYFGGSIAKRIIETIEDGFLPENCTIVEIGAHHGYLLADIIQFIYTLKPQLLQSLQFSIVEKHPYLKQQQIKYFNDSFGEVIQLTHYEDIQDLHLESAYLVANEIFDAFPCELIYTNKNNIRQQGFVNNHKITFEACEDEYLNTICDKYHIQKGEISLGYENFTQTLCQNIQKFEFLSFDYGEKYARNDFSTRVYHQHTVYPLFDDTLKLKEHFSLSDITYDVNFSHLMDCFKEQNCQEIKFQTQLKTLVEFGIQDLLQILKDNADENTFLKEVQKVKTLLDPTSMGERFKAIIVRK